MKEKIEEVKEHIRRNKITYIVGAVGLAGITLAIMREPRTALRGGADRLVRESTGSFNSAKSVFGSVSNNVVTTVHRAGKGASGYITRCVETGELFETQGDAARAYCIPEQIMSAHLNRGFSLVENLHFERVGVLSA